MTLLKADYINFDLSSIKGDSGDIYVTMNPPFRGYGVLSKRKRRELQRAVPDLQGRFNMAHAFLKRTITELQPKTVVALMPGAWPIASYNDLQSLLRRKENKWKALPDSIFHGATTTAGVVVLHNFERPTLDGKRSLHRRKKSSMVVRQGVATGADDVFFTIAGLRPRIGRIVHAVRGRDIAIGLKPRRLPTIWIPPNPESEGAISIIDELEIDEKKKLALRYCVRKLGAPIWEYHERMPQWFLGSPKLIVPEVCTKMSVCLDLDGAVLPLHSTIAILSSNKKSAKSVSELLLTTQAWRFLRKRCPKMVNRAIR
ncbi:MAG: hypothetical protein KAW09_11305, partial [Thermoplasmata archaeon]|nr:hypothetical protein [Thermoplasmata archaeon]